MFVQSKTERDVRGVSLEVEREIKWIRQSDGHRLGGM